MSSEKIFHITGVLLGFFEIPILYWEEWGCFDESRKGSGRAWPEGW